ncbi:MAG TPA: DUF2244 domain-containing protein [Acetobacteraceae bacterium]
MPTLLPGFGAGGKTRLRSTAACAMCSNMDGQHAQDGSVLFEAVIVPHRSLSRRGLLRLQALIVGLCCLTGLRFWMLGAWPVLAFSFVEIGFAVALLSLNARRARASELVLLSEDSVRVLRTDARGRRQQTSIDSAWLNVVLEEDHGRVPRLLLVARNAREEIGTVLGEAEKRDLASALRTALHRARNPRFDNPQLRE